MTAKKTAANYSPEVRDRAVRLVLDGAGDHGAPWVAIGSIAATIERIHHALYVALREGAGRDASPTTAIIDSQAPKGAQKGALRSTRPATTRARRLSAASATC